MANSANTNILPQVTTAVVNLPEAGTSANVKLEPGAYTQFAFNMDQIDNVALRPDGALELKLSNGSTMVIQNFKELANSAESCGRDTVFQMLDAKVDGAGHTSTKIVNVSPDALLKSLDPSLVDDHTVALNAPAANMTKEVMMEPGQTYKINFDWATAAKTIDGTNLMLSFKNGGLMVLRDFVPVSEGNLPPVMTLADGTAVDISTLVVAACSPAQPIEAAEKAAAVVPTQSELRAPNIEPAAGDKHAHHEAQHAQHAAKKMASNDDAQNVADIEPAAGGGDSPASGGRGGAGFSSGIDDANLNGLNPLGPIAPTALAYNIPKVEDFPVSGDNTPGGTNPNPPPAPSLTVEDRQVYEDEAINVILSSTAPAGTTTVITVSGIPAGWTVDAGLGTYDAATGTWTITLPAGSTFTGGPILTTPADADGDIIVLDVTAVATDTTTGLTSESQGNITVVTDAVADDPNLTASAAAGGTEDAGADLVITTSPSDTDGSEVISAVYVRGLPAGFTLNHGTVQTDGSVLLSTADLADLKVFAPANYSGTINIQVQTVVTETNLSGGEFDYTNNVATKTVEVPVTFAPVADVPELVVHDVRVYEDGSVQVPVEAYLTDRDGSEFLTIKIENIPAGWGVDANGGSYDSTTGTWTITLPAGTDFSGGPILSPPANADVDALDLKVTATSTETGNGDTADMTGNANVLTDAVADAPDLTATPSVTGEQDLPVALTIASNLNDTDGSEVLSLVITGVPTGATLSAGVLQPDGSYLLTPAQLAGLTVTPATGYVGSFTLVVTSTATETNLSGDEYRTDNNVASTSTEILVTITEDDIPVLAKGESTVDETDLTTGVTVSGSVNPQYGSDTGSVAAQGASSFVASGSLTAGALTHDGVPVAVTLDGNTYVGKAGDVTVFTLQVNANGTYTFTQLQNLDHADGTNPNDVIALTFGVTATDSDGDSTNGTITINVKDDAPTAIDDVDATVNGVATGNVTDNDSAGQDNPGTVVAVSFNGASVDVPATGTVSIAGLYGVLVIAATGAYTYTGNNGANGTDVFSYVFKDRDGDTDPANLDPTLTITTTDGQPTIDNASNAVDETNLGPITVTGTVAHSFGTDGAGSITAQGAGSFTSTGSKLGGNLTHEGVPVTVTLDTATNTYVGSAGATTVFTLHINADGSYAYQQLATLDHADGSDANDVITLNFGVQIADVDGDTDTGTISIAIKDDAPTAVDEPCADIAYGTDHVSGNVVTNDVLSHDVTNNVTAIKFGTTTVDVPETGTATIHGEHGTLVISANGDYTYTLDGGTGSGSGTPGTFTETLGFPVVGEGNPKFNEASPNEGVNPTALDINSAAAASVQVLSETAGYSNTLGLYTIAADGTIQAAQVVSANINDLALGGTTDFNIPAGGEGVGFFLIADGYSLNGGYAGLDFSTGTLSFVANYGDVDQRDAKVTDAAADITLVFTDTSGHATVLSGPVYHTTDRDGTYDINPDGRVHTISGLADANDPSVLRIGFEDLPGTGDADYSDVVFDFKYTPTTTEGCDEFTYVLTDGDGDSSSAVICFDCETKPDGYPTIGDVTYTVDETNLGPIVVNGTYAYDFGTDGAGAITAEGVASFNSTGSKLGGNLTHDGVPVTVTLDGNTYTGVAGSVTVFTLQVGADGSYTFTQLQNLDHADGTNPNDVITLNFGVKITDVDGDTDTGVITINVQDDAPTTVDDVATLVNGVATGNVTDNDNAGQDNAGTVASIAFGGVVTNVPATGTVSVAGLFGVLVIAATGAYTYTANNGANGTDVFNYVFKDRDGDTDPAHLSATLTVTTTDGQPCIGDSSACVDETNLGPVTVGGTYAYNYGPDGAGHIAAGDVSTFTSTGSKLGGALTHNGVPVTVTLDTATNTYTGHAGDVNVFTMQVKTDGTYTFTLLDNLDHADAANANDIINLNFAVNITDADGDTDTGVITIAVKDDAPCANDDQQCSTDGKAITGNVLSNDVSTESPFVSAVTFNGHTYTVTDAGTTVHGDHGTLVIERDGDYTYTPEAHTTTTHITSLDPNSCDVADRCDPVITKNGITVEAINPECGVLLKDLTWVDGGIGVDGNKSIQVNGTTEGLRVSLDCPADIVHLTLGNLSSADLKTGINVDIYLSGSNDPVHIELNAGTKVSDGVYDFTLNAADYGSCEISKLVVSADDSYSNYCGTGSGVYWTLVDVCTYDVTTTAGEDKFTYTVSDADYDTDTAMLALCSIAPKDDCNTGCDTPTTHGDCNVVAFCDDVTTAIDNFVCATTVENCVTNTTTVCNTVETSVSSSVSYSYEQNTTVCITNTQLDDQHKQAA